MRSMGTTTRIQRGVCLAIVTDPVDELRDGWKHVAVGCRDAGVCEHFDELIGGGAVSEAVCKITGQVECSDISLPIP